VLLSFVTNPRLIVDVDVDVDVDVEGSFPSSLVSEHRDFMYETGT
jgi:hypothetical protein